MKRQLLSLICVMAGVLSIPAIAGTTSGSGSMTGAEPTMTPRFFRDGVGGPACSGFSSGSFQYQAIDLTSDASGTMTASFDPGVCGTGIFVTFHSPEFTPNSICTGHLWSFGSSAAFAGQAFAVPPNSPIKMIVSGVANAPGVACGPFTYSVSGTGAGAPLTVTENVNAAIAGIEALNPPTVTGPAQKNTMILLLRTALQYQGNPNSSLALAALNSVIKNTDGCALRATPDAITRGAEVDYITTCPAQATVYPNLVAARNLLLPP